jgi:hypothetical protein
MVLWPGVHVRARVLGAFGEPVAGADVDVFVSGADGPSVARTRTSADGIFELASVPRWADVAITARGFAARVVPVEATSPLGSRMCEVVLASGRIAKGTVFDPTGSPVEGVGVRSGSGPDARGMRAITDERGAFLVPGLSASSVLSFHHPAAPDNPWSIEADAWAESERGLHVGLSREGFVAREGRRDGERVEVRVHLVPYDPDVTRLRLVSRWGRAFEAPVEEGAFAGTASFRVPPGGYRPAAVSAFEPVEWEHRETRSRSSLGPEGHFSTSPEGGVTEVDLVGSERPRLVVDAHGTDLRDVVAAVEGEATEESYGRRMHLPALARAAVRVEDLGRTFFADVGPPSEGVRRATLRVPPRHRIRLEGGVEDARLVAAHDRSRPIPFERRRDLVETRAEGPVVLRFLQGGRPREVPLDLPAEAAADPIVVTADAPVAPATRVPIRALLADGTPARASVDHESPTGATGFSIPLDDWEMDLPVSALVHSRGLQPLRVEVRVGDEAPVARFGSAGVRLRVSGPDGEPVDARVAIDGWLHNVFADSGALEVAGLGEGRHEVLVSPGPGDLRGARLRFTLRAGETLDHGVRLARRESEE